MATATLAVGQVQQVQTKKINGVGHFFSMLAHGFVKAGQAIKGTLVKIEQNAPQIQKVADEAELIVEAVTGELYPPAVIVERAAFHVFGEAVAAATAAGQAADANGINVSLDVAAIQKIKQAAGLMAQGFPAVPAAPKTA